MRTRLHGAWFLCGERRGIASRRQDTESTGPELARLHAHLQGEAVDPEIFRVSPRWFGVFSQRRINGFQSPITAAG